MIMPNVKVSGSESKPGIEPFITIDDLVHKAQELSTGLEKLSEYKYPLDIRRGVRKGVKKRMRDNGNSIHVFPEDIGDFAQAVSEIATRLSEGKSF